VNLVSATKPMLNNMHSTPTENGGRDAGKRWEHE
jgi:hypothetical protein